MTSWLGRRPRAPGSGVGSAAAARERRRRAHPRRSGRRGRPPPAGTNSGGPPTRVATTERPRPAPPASTGRRARRGDGWQTTSAAARQRRDSSCATRPASRMRARPSSCGPQRPVADEGERPLAEPLEGAREPEHVLPLGQRADAEERRAALPVARAGCGAKALEVDAAVDHLRLRRAPPGTRSSSTAAQVLGDRDHRVRAARRRARRGARRRDRADVRDVLAVRGDDERRAAGSAAQSPAGTRKCA